MKKLLWLVPLAFLLPVAGQGQTIIKEIKQVSNGSEKPIKHDVFDTRANLRVYWDKDVLQKKLAELGTPADVSAELQHAGRLADVSRRGLAAVEAFNRAVVENPQALDTVIGRLGVALREGISAAPSDYQRLQAAFSGAIQPATTREQKIANIGRASAAVFNELAKMSAEAYARIAQKLKESNVNFWVVANVSRDDDPTRRREVPFLSPLTAADVEALNAIRDFAKNFGGEPSDLFKAQWNSARNAAKKVIEDAKAALNTQLADVQAKWDALFAAYRDNQAVNAELTNVKDAVDALKTKITSSITSLQANLDSIRTGDPATRTDAIARLQEASAAIAGARATFASFAELPARAADVKTAADRLAAALEATARQAVQDFQAFLTGLEKNYKDLEAALDGIAKGSVQTLFDALGIGLHMKQIAEIVQQGDIARDYADLDMTTNNGQPLRLAAGDEVIVGVKMAKSETPPDKFAESRRLYAYPDRWTSDRLIPIVFTQRTDRDATTGDRKDSWRFSPTYMDVFKRYSTGRSAGSNRWFTPGIGVAITALDQNADDSFEIGLGAGLTLFDDRLIGGIGFNTQSNRSYAFFGIRLRLSDVGIRD